MSRMRRLKKEKIKATMSGLALMIAIGVAGGVGSYAYFTDQAEAKNDLVVTMGNLDVNFKDKSNDISITNDNYESNYFTQTFKISNDGTLKQNVQFRFTDIAIEGSTAEGKVLQNINYELNMTYNGREVILESNNNKGTLSELKGMSLSELKYEESEELVQLASDENIECTLTIKLKDKSESTLKEVQNNKIKFKTEAKSVQLGGDM